MEIINKISGKIWDRRSIFFIIMGYLPSSSRLPNFPSLFSTGCFAPLCFLFPMPSPLSLRKWRGTKGRKEAIKLGRPKFSRYDTIRYETIRYDTTRYDTIRYDKMEKFQVFENKPNTLKSIQQQV